METTIMGYINGDVLCLTLLYRKGDKGTLLGTPNREPQEYSRNIRGMYLPGSLYSIIFLLYSWGSLFGVPSKVPLGDIRCLRRVSLDKLRGSCRLSRNFNHG